MNSEQFAQFMQFQKTLIDKVVSIQQNPPRIQTQVQDLGASPVNIALLPSFENFDSKKESFRNYKQRFENYLIMKGISSNKEYCAKLLLNSIGAQNFNIVAALAAPRTPGELTFEELTNLLEKHLAPKKNVLVAQHQFLSKYQNENQSIAEYVAALRSDIGDCEFISPCECAVSITDTFLRAQFIRGIKDNSIREKLLQSEISIFNDIVTKAIALEVSKIDSKELAQKTSTPCTDINKVTQHTTHTRRKDQKKFHKQPQKRYTRSQSRARGQSKSRIDYNELGIEGLCLRCGRDNHLANDCRTEKSKLKCTGCKKTGHVIKVCIRSLIDKKNQSDQPSTNYVREEAIYNQYGVHQIVDIYQSDHLASRGNNARYHTHVDIEGKPVEFEVDSGSGYTFLPRDQFDNLKIKVPLQPVTIGFRSYTQNVFVPDGKIKVNVGFNGRTIQDEIYIVPEEYTALLGRSWIRRLKIDLNEIDRHYSNSTSTHAIEGVNKIDEVIAKFPDVFEERIGCVPDFKVVLKLREKATPVFHREREVPYALRDRVEKELDTLEASGIITRTETSDWGSPLVVIPKADGGVRLCVDYKVGVNERLVGSHYPIRKIEDVLNGLRNSRYFCRLDLFKAYLHIPVDEQSSEIQTISTQRGTYRMNRLSFGIKTAPAEFNRIIDQILRDVPKTESYFDDIIVHGETKQECEANLIACLNQLRKFDLHLNRRKCSLFQERIEFLGHIVEFDKISKSPEKVAAITEMPRPTSIEELKRFLGMVTYYARFIPSTSTITAPLRQLLKKNAVFKWTTQCEAAFVKLKQEVASDRVLMPFNPELPIRLACDASPTGIAGILSHVIDNQERPIAFASRSLTQAERNYSQLDREALAIVFAVDHFFQYLFARSFTLITDNRPLVRIFHQNAKLPQMTSARLQRYAAFLSGFNYKAEFKRGSENTNVDCLSRAPIKPKPRTDSAINEEVHQLCEASVSQIAGPTLTYQSIREETSKDENLSKAIEDLRKNNTTNPEFTIDNDIVFRGQRVVIPTSLQAAVLRELHHTHIGITKMKQLARRYVYWKSVDKDIERVVRACPMCATVKGSPVKAPLHPWEEPESNWQRLHIDYAGPYQGHYFLVIIDAKSKWAEIESCAAAPTSASTIEILKDVFSRHGFPDVMVSDNATIFTSDLFQDFCRRAGIFQKFIAPGHPATNGLAERNVQTLKHRLGAMADEPLTMRQKVQEILFRYRATPLKNNRTPAEQYLQRQIRIQFDALKPAKFQSSTVPDRKARQLSVGERVQARYYSNNKAQWKPATIIKKFGQLHYWIEMDDGHKLKRHIDQLRSTGVQPKKSISFAPGISDEPVPDQNNQDIDIEDLMTLPGNQPGQDDHGFSNNTHEPMMAQAEGTNQSERRSNRPRRRPQYLDDYVVDKRQPH